MPKDVDKPPPPTDKPPIGPMLGIGLLRISKSSIDRLLRAGLSLDENAARELLRQVDARLKALIRATTELERKIHIIMGFDIIVPVLVLSTDLATATDAGHWLLSWSLLLSLLVTTAFCSLALLGVGLFRHDRIAVPGTRPDEWSTEHLTAASDSMQAAPGLASGRICAHLIRQYGDRIKQCERTYDDKVRHYKRGLWCSCALGVLLVPAVFVRIWA